MVWHHQGKHFIFIRPQNTNTQTLVHSSSYPFISCIHSCEHWLYEYSFRSCCFSISLNETHRKKAKKRWAELQSHFSFCLHLNHRITPTKWVAIVLHTYSGAIHREHANHFIRQYFFYILSLRSQRWSARSHKHPEQEKNSFVYIRMRMRANDFSHQNISILIRLGGQHPARAWPHYTPYRPK